MSRALVSGPAWRRGSGPDTSCPHRPTATAGPLPPDRYRRTATARPLPPDRYRPTAYRRTGRRSLGGDQPRPPPRLGSLTSVAGDPTGPVGPVAERRPAGTVVDDRAVLGLETSPANPTTRRIVEPMLREHAARSAARTQTDPTVAAVINRLRPSSSSKPGRARSCGSSCRHATTSTSPTHWRCPSCWNAWPGNACSRWPPEEPQHAPPARRAERRPRHDRLPAVTSPGSNGR